MLHVYHPYLNFQLLKDCGSRDDLTTSTWPPRLARGNLWVIPRLTVNSTSSTVGSWNVPLSWSVRGSRFARQPDFAVTTWRRLPLPTGDKIVKSTWIHTEYKWSVCGQVNFKSIFWWMRFTASVLEASHKVTIIAVPVDALCTITKVNQVSPCDFNHSYRKPYSCFKFNQQR